MVLLKRLYVENYKLFSRKEIDFSNALLSVFDGPNGYGKTSIFDAIELLITGKISRVEDCESIDGKQAYETVFFAQNSDKDVILKAEFEDVDEKSTFTIGAKVKPTDISGRSANPKYVFEKVEYYYLLSYDVSIDSWDDYLQNAEQMEELRNNKFGVQNIEQFTLFHYIRQEDRLSYFKQSESSRAKTIESLLGVAEETEKYKKIQSKRKSIDSIFKNISQELDSKKQRVRECNQSLFQAIEYKPLLNGEQAWDKESVFFGDSNQESVLTQYLTEIERIESYVKFKDIHSRYFAYEAFMKIPEKLRNDVIHALVLLQDKPCETENLETSLNNLVFLKKQKELIQLQEYGSLNISKINDVLEISVDDSLVSEIDKLIEISKNQGELQKVLNNVLRMRDNLHLSHSQVAKDGICPYCGYDWKTNEELEIKFVSTKEILQKLLSQDGELYAKQLETIKLQVEEGILININDRIEELSKMEILAVYEKFETKEKYVSAIEKAKNIFNISKNQLLVKDKDINNNNQYLYKMIEECASIGSTIPEEYLSDNEKYKFLDICKKYFLNQASDYKLGKEDFDNKRQYLQEQFYKSFDKIKEEIKKLEAQMEVIEGLQSQIKEYEKAIKRAIENYKKQIIDEIEIPFFVYSSRLLQSYQGGQGVLMKNDGGSIRFTSPGKEHDILYTMSSGQLSAVLLSFSLALNKIYSGNGIKTVLIDDPIQCMDDINMISFVELLRREFSGSQIIMSTHEADFSNFIRYKFKKYGLDAQDITLKDA